MFFSTCIPVLSHVSQLTSESGAEMHFRPSTLPFPLFSRALSAPLMLSKKKFKINARLNRTFFP